MTSFADVDLGSFPDDVLGAELTEIVEIVQRLLSCALESIYLSKYDCYGTFMKTLHYYCRHSVLPILPISISGNDVPKRAMMSRNRASTPVTTRFAHIWANNCLFLNRITLLALSGS
jgi:hypothetical protein